MAPPPFWRNPPLRGSAPSLYIGAWKNDPRLGALLEGIGRTASLTGNHRLAADTLRTAVALTPERDGLRQQLAGEMLTSGDLAGASQARTLLAKKPKDAALLNLLGVIQKRRGAIAGALETFRAGTEAAPSDHSAWYNLGNTLLEKAAMAKRWRHWSRRWRAIEGFRNRAPAGPVARRFRPA